MIWPFRKRAQALHENSISEDVERIDEKLKDVEDKLAADQDKAKQIAKAVASARRVQYRVDQFTEEYAKSFGRANHG